ncbi:TonB system transport protein ExbD [Vibrio europaeus]|uniref:TonB system transport protein ExbD n=1 Tax=Vibrio europaeus TaxID=300876 RepID=UPI00148BBD9B|nr:TonB system transport protein ExbD [Vibrio europaeus]MDC5838022.1 TonB system transport protein ExbD [Vibrio europaeus]MDC5850493.1 TonB system transport protein ExbD [Vibrio europaeus]NOH22726.1 TonB system transport protein ExbD [Vibrio europaeus]
MGFNVSSQQDELAVNHEINITPFVDVMLVLLIIVMVAAPLATVNVPVELPTSSANPSPQPKDPIYLTVSPDLALTLGENTQVNLEQLPRALDQALTDKEQRIYLRADKTLDYQSLMKVMNVLVASGYVQIALVGLESTENKST